MAAVAEGFGKGQKSPPAAPAPIDPNVQIAAQARAQPSTYSPFGNIVYSGDPNAGTYRSDISLSPEEQAKLGSRNDIAMALLGRSKDALSSLPTGYKFDGATDPTTNKFFTAQKALLDPVWNQDQEREQQRLANQGIPEGSDAYSKSMDEFTRRRASAYEQASTNALNSGYAQDIGTRQQNLNEVAQALGGAQLNPITPAGGSVDSNGAFANQQAGINRQYQGQLAGYNAGVAGNNAAMGGLFQLGAAALPFMVSDRRLKRDIERMGELMPGVGWYSFNYVWDKSGARRHEGVMADELALVMPEAVLYDGEGFAMVDYGRLFAGRTVH